MSGIKTIAELLDKRLIDKEDESSLVKVAEDFQISITNHLVSNTDKSSKSLSQFIPDKKELNNSDKVLVDPIGDIKHTKVKGIVHRYPDRVLLKPVNVCPVYCRFCFRKEKVGPGNKALTPQELDKCYEYIKSDKDIWEVILTGGEPLYMKPKTLSSVLDRLQQIEHVEVIRLHTRVPSVAPELITSDMLNTLKSVKPLYMVLHINHPDEFTKESIQAIEKLADSGIVLLSQSVLLKGVNDNINTLSSLMKLFVKNRIKPYYLHHLDLVKGAEHFRVSIKHGQELVAKLQGNVSGICQPTYVLDIPGGFGKIPIAPCYISNEIGENYKLIDYKGHRHTYLDK